MFETETRLNTEKSHESLSFSASFISAEFIICSTQASSDDRVATLARLALFTCMPSPPGTTGGWYSEPDCVFLKLDGLPGPPWPLAVVLSFP